LRRRLSLQNRKSTGLVKGYRRWWRQWIEQGETGIPSPRKGRVFCQIPSRSRALSDLVITSASCEVPLSESRSQAEPKSGAIHAWIDCFVVPQENCGPPRKDHSWSVITSALCEVICPSIACPAVRDPASEREIQKAERLWVT